MFPDIKEKDYLGEGGYRVDDKAGKVGQLPATAHNRLACWNSLPLEVATGHQ